MDETAAAATARALAEAGIKRVFGLPGGEILVLMDELRRAGVDFVLMRHEANAGIAAAVYGKLQRQPGVVLTTLGPGAANLMLPLANAYLEQEPLLAISAQIPDDYPASHTHQLLPLHDVYRPVTRLTAKITAANASAVVSRALDACMTRPFGTAYLTLSAREALKRRDGAEPGGGGDGGSEPPNLHALPRGDAREAARQLTTLLASARRPLVLLGLGIDPVNAGRIRRWVSDWGLPVAVTPKVKGFVDETGPTFVGVIGGMAADGLMCEAIEAADVRVGFGFDPVEVDKTWHAELPIYWVLEAPNVGGIIPPGVTLVDHAPLLDCLVASPAPAVWADSFHAFQQKRRELLNRPSSTDIHPPHSSGEGRTMWPGDIVNALAGACPRETIVTTDVGSHKYLFGQFWPSRDAETFWMSNGLSGMAYGLSAAIGAKLARPDAPVLAAVGDGGFSMNAQELETAERVGAPFVTLVLEDRTYSLIKLSQEGKQLPPYRTDFSPIDTVKMAESCGVEGLRTTDRGELASAARTAFARGRSLVIGVPVAYADYRRLF
jgi:acetolactate synthase-1/2/3 large subunit